MEIKYRKNSKNNKGITLIELVVAIGILGIVAVSILQLFGSGFINIIRAGNHSKAQFVAQDVIEQDLNDRANTSTINNLNIILHSINDIEVQGEIKTEQADVGRGSVSVVYFKPHR